MTTEIQLSKGTYPITMGYGTLFSYARQNKIPINEIADIANIDIPQITFIGIQLACQNLRRDIDLEMTDIYISFNDDPDLMTKITELLQESFAGLGKKKKTASRRPKTPEDRSKP